MSHEDNVFTLLVESNPIPRVEDIELDEVGGDRYLDTLERRSSEMTKLDTRRTETRSYRKNAPWLVAAVGVVIVGIAILLVAQRGDVEPVAPIPITTTPEQIESLVVATLGDKLRSVDNFELGQPPYYRFTVEWKDSADPDAIQKTAQDLANAFMRQGVYTIGMTVRTDEETSGLEIIGASGAILHLEDDELAVEIDWTNVGHNFSPDDFMYTECNACP